MRGKNKQKTEKKRTGKSFITLFSGLSSVFAAILLYGGTEAFFIGDGRAAPVLTICLSVLFMLTAVLIHRSASASKSWADASLFAAAVLTAAGILSLIMIGKALKPAEIGLTVLLVVLTGSVYLLRNRKTERTEFFIPVILGFIASATGILTLNTVSWMVYNNGNPGTLWIGFFFSVFLLILSRFLTAQAYAEKPKDNASLITFGSGFFTQFAAMLFGTAYGVPDRMRISQICVLAAFSILTVIFYRRYRSAPTMKGKRRKNQ